MAHSFDIFFVLSRDTCLHTLEDKTFQLQVDKFKPYPDLMAELFKAMARSPPTKRRK